MKNQISLMGLLLSTVTVVGLFSPAFANSLYLTPVSQKQKLRCIEITEYLEVIMGDVIFTNHQSSTTGRIQGDWRRKNLRVVPAKIRNLIRPGLAVNVIEPFNYMISRDGASSINIATNGYRNDGPVYIMTLNPRSSVVELDLGVWKINPTSCH